MFPSAFTLFPTMISLDMFPYSIPAVVDLATPAKVRKVPTIRFAPVTSAVSSTTLSTVRPDAAVPPPIAASAATTSPALGQTIKPACPVSRSVQPSSSRFGDSFCPLIDYCSPSTLSCGVRPADSIARVTVEQQIYPETAAADVSGHASHRKSVPLPDGSACPVGFSACPIARKNSPDDFLFACFDFLSSETHCGGCHDVGAGFWMEALTGVDCTSLPGVSASSCVDGKCQVCESVRLPPVYVLTLTLPAERSELL